MHWRTWLWVGGLCLLLGLSLSCSRIRDRESGRPLLERDSELALLAEWMTGSFSSQAQAGADSSFFDIRLEVARIWSERTDAVWLYVEQAVADHRDSPYRQRVYRLESASPHNFTSAVYLLPEPGRFVGAWRDEDRFAILAPDSLEERKGCVVTLWRQEESTFVGQTDKRCPSDLYGAAYATSEVKISAEGMESWDRGFDEAGKQVWGAVTGAYRFTKLYPTGASELR